MHFYHIWYQCGKNITVLRLIKHHNSTETKSYVYVCTFIVICVLHNKIEKETRWNQWTLIIQQGGQMAAVHNIPLVLDISFNRSRFLRKKREVVFFEETSEKRAQPSG